MLDRWSKKWGNSEDHRNQREEGQGEAQILFRGLVRQTKLLVGTVGLVVVLILSSTVAWFTNISKTSDLLFQVKAWGVDEDRIHLDLEGSELSMMPGTNGMIPLRVDNSGNETDIKLVVSVSKENMEDELRKRIYFYVDQGVMLKDENGTVIETAPRTYLSSQVETGAKYVVLRGEQLTLLEDYSNDVPVKWRWVYDMEGYYFWGQVIPDQVWSELSVPAESEDGEEVNASDGSTDGSVSGDLAMEQIIVDEYLRPVEYEYETAVYDQNGMLLRANGQEISDFLQTISYSDGYSGIIGGGITAQGKTYYPVQVDETGYGVWCYLCTRNEIEDGIVYDNSLRDRSMDPEVDMSQLTGTITLTVVAQNIEAERQEVKDEAELLAALENESVDVIELGTDLQLANTIPVTEGMQTILNLNGYTLTAEETVAFSVSQGGTLTLLNGTLRGNQEADSVGVYSVGGKVTLSGMTMEEMGTAVLTEDQKALMGDSVVKVSGCNFTTGQTAVLIYGNGSATDSLTEVVIQDSTIVSTDGIAVSGQGSVAESGAWGTSITILNSTVTGRWAGIYHPQQRSSMLIRDCEINGFTGVAIKGGTVTVRDSVISGTGSGTDLQLAAAFSGGFTDTGDGVYMEATYSWPATLILKGDNRVTSANAYAVELFGRKNSGPGQVRIEAGEYEGALGAAHWNGAGRFEIYGGAFEGTVHTGIQRFDLPTQS